jgi:accessory gene regulator B
VLKKLADTMSNEWVERKIVDDKAVDVAKYGFEILVSSLSILFGVLLIGILLNIFIEVVVFVIFFGILRVSAGGAHARSHSACFLYFSIILFVSIFISYCLVVYTQIAPIVAVLMFLVSWLFIELYAPKESENKPLSLVEKRIFKNRSKISIAILGIGIIFMYLIAKEDSIYYMVAATALFVEGLTLMDLNY